MPPVIPMTSPVMTLPVRVFAVLVATVTLAGCQPEAVSTTESPAIVSDADHEHGHPHVHGDAVAHDHDHDDFSGSHSHDHEHPHRHGDDGEELVSIGHTHHDRGVTDYHARIGPRTDDRLVVTLLVDEGGSDLKPLQDGPASFDAIIGSDRNTGLTSRTTSFQPIADGAGQYAASLGNVDLSGDLILVVVPAIELGGERLDFSFPLPAAKTGHPDDGTGDGSGDGSDDGSGDGTADSGAAE